MKITLVEPRGFCFGVSRALTILDNAPKGAYVLHEIVHNTAVVESYKKQGFSFVESLDSIPEGAHVVFSAHGVSQKVEAQATAQKLHVIDATCPYVRLVHQWVKKLEDDNRTVILIGKKNHAEVIGTFGQLKSPEKAFVISSLSEVETLPDLGKIGIATQTTFSKDDSDKITAALKERFNDCLTKSGICNATAQRQEALKQACLDHDTILVVGDRKSANAMRLIELAQKAGRQAFLIENADEVQKLPLGKSIAITAAASAPESIVQQLVRTLSPQHIRE